MEDDGPAGPVAGLLVWSAVLVLCWCCAGAVQVLCECRDCAGAVRVSVWCRCTDPGFMNWCCVVLVLCVPVVGVGAGNRTRKVDLGASVGYAWVLVNACLCV